MKITKWGYEMSRLQETQRSLQATMALANHSIAYWEQTGDHLLIIEFKPQIERLNFYLNALTDLIGCTEVLHQIEILAGNFINEDPDDAL